MKSLKLILLRPLLVPASFFLVSTGFFPAFAARISAKVLFFGLRLDGTTLGFSTAASSSQKIAKPPLPAGLIGTGVMAVLVAAESAMVLLLVLARAGVERVSGSSSQKTAKAAVDAAGRAVEVKVVDLTATLMVVASVVGIVVITWALSSAVCIELELKLGDVAVTAAAVTAAEMSTVDELAEVKPKVMLV
jgi:hypothetical protein